MPVTKLFKLHAITLGATHVGATESQTITPGITVTTDAASGLARPEFQAITAIKPTVDFTGYDVASLLAALTSVGKNIADLGDVVLYGQAIDDGGTRTTGSTHYSFSIANGLVFPATLSVSHQQFATLACKTVVTYDGTNQPIIPAASAALPTIDDDARFGIGDVTIGGVDLTQVTQLTVDFGLDVKPVGSDSEVYDTFAYIATIKPRITLRGTLPTWFGASGVPLDGLTCTQANTTIYLRKYDNGGTFVADATAEHIKINAAGIATVGSLTASNEGEGEVEIMVDVGWDGTNESLLINTASAIGAAA